MIDRARMMEVIISNHYLKSVPSGKSHYYSHDGAIIVFSIPANYNTSRFLIGEPKGVWELSRLWAADDHAPNLLTKIIKIAIRQLRLDEPDVVALISYADPNAGHQGGVYKAASWQFIGVSEESRGYKGPDGLFVPRRKFHSGSRHLNKQEIEALGYTQMKMPGKRRFAKGLTRRSRKLITQRFA